MELRDGELSSGSVKVEVVRDAASQQMLQSVHVSRLSDNTHHDVFTLRIMVLTHAVHALLVMAHSHTHTHTHTHTLHRNGMGWTVLCVAMRCHAVFIHVHEYSYV